MPLELLNPNGPGSYNDWGVVGSSTGWEAVGKGSEDSSYIGSSTVTSKSSFFCGDGRVPICGFVSSLIVWVRVRRAEVSSGGSLTLVINQNGVLRTVDTFSIPPSNTDWVDYFAFVRSDWTTLLRFTNSDMHTLEVGVELTSLPDTGGFDISELYINVEQQENVYYYDPFMGVTPDLVVGDRQSGTGGTEPASITGDNHLEIVDSLNTNQRTYIYPQYLGVNKPVYVKEIQTRLEVTALPVEPTGCVAHVAIIMDLNRGVSVNYFMLGGIPHIGISDIFNDPNDPSSYLALAPLVFFNTSRHVRIRYDQSLNPDDKGKVEVFVDYDLVPILQINYEDVPDPFPPPFPLIIFGTSSARAATEKVDYFTFRTFKRNGYSFRDYTEIDDGINHVVADPNDPFVNNLVVVPPGVQSGQSDRSCKLEGRDDTYQCGFYTIFTNYIGAAALYDLVVDYRSTELASTSLEVMCQRCSDLFYWNEGGSSWQSNFYSLQLPPTANTRRRVTVFNNINQLNPGGLLFTFRITFPPVGAITPLDVWLYRLHLTN